MSTESDDFAWLRKNGCSSDRLDRIEARLAEAEQRAARAETLKGVYLSQRDRYRHNWQAAEDKALRYEKALREALEDHDANIRPLVAGMPETVQNIYLNARPWVRVARAVLADVSEPPEARPLLPYGGFEPL